MPINKTEKKELLEKNRAVDEDGWKAQYKIEVNTPFQSIGKYYNMVLKELSSFGFKNLVRIDQSLAASPTSGFYGDVAQRKAYAKDQFDKGMGLVNNIVQTVIKLIYSLREFDLVLDIYKRLEENDDTKKISAELNLRRIFMDEVDIKKGRGSMNNLTTAQGMEFVSLRDNFLVIKDLKSIDDLTVNDRVKRILKERFAEYEDWKNAYKKDVEGRRKIQRQYLRNQIESLKMQLDWVKPYYTLMQQLDISSGVADPDLLPGIDTTIITTKIRGIIGGAPKKLATAFADVEFRFKTSPIQVRSEQGQAYHHRFKTEIIYTPYVMSNSDYEKIVEVETLKDIDFLKEIVGQSLDAIKDDLEKYMKGEDIKEEEKKEKPLSPFGFLVLPFKPLFAPLLNPPKLPASTSFSSYKLANDMKELNEKIIDTTFGVYENFKDENSFYTWSASLA
ncbi:MAG: hypothetical protein JW791_04805 [Nanoarchaeota archaeon]|nr:hypothetical protein [Nanoarchaeota archaeon]